MSLAVITGATGLLGGNLAAALCAAGVRVRAVRAPAAPFDHLRHLDVDWAVADVNDEPALRRAFTGADVVFHAAALVTNAAEVTPAIRRVNVDGTARVLAATRAAGAARLVHVSTAAAIGVSTDGRPCDERTAWNLDRYGLADGYARSKREAEALVRAAHDVDAVIVNPTYLLGPLDARPSSGGLLLDLARRRIPAWPSGANDFADVRDVARGLIAAWHRGARGERYLLGGEHLTYRALFDRIATAAGVAPPRFPAPRLAAMALGRVGDVYRRLTGRVPLTDTASVRYAYSDRFRYSSARAERELGYRHGSIDDAIRDALAWFRQRNML